MCFFVLFDFFEFYFTDNLYYYYNKILIYICSFKDVNLTVSYHEYWKRLQEHCNIKMYAICRVKETGQTWSEEDDFIVEKPKLEIQVTILCLHYKLLIYVFFIL